MRCGEGVCKRICLAPYPRDLGITQTKKTLNVIFKYLIDSYWICSVLCFAPLPHTETVHGFRPADLSIVVALTCVSLLSPLHDIHHLL